MSAFDKQVGGDHYKQYVISPYKFFVRNKITHEKAAIIRRILRHDHPTGKGVEDIDKIIHECELIKELLYDKETVKPDRVAIDGAVYTPNCEHQFSPAVDPNSKIPYCICGNNYIKYDSK